MTQAASEGIRGGPTARRLLLAAGCALLVLLAVALEVLSGQRANSTEGPLTWIVPLGWPQPLRVAWWLTIAATAASSRLLLDDRVGPRRHVLAALFAAPFLAFAVGIAASAEWATWH